MDGHQFCFLKFYSKIVKAVSAKVLLVCFVSLKESTWEAHFEALLILEIIKF